MVKPQFEVGRELVGKGGVVKDPLARKAAIESVIAIAVDLGLECRGQTDAKIQGPKGNQETFVHLALQSDYCLGRIGEKATL